MLTGTLLFVCHWTLNSKSGNVKYVGESFQVAKAAKEGVVLNARNIEDYLEKVAKKKVAHLVEDQTETLGMLGPLEQVRRDARIQVCLLVVCVSHV